MGKEGSRASYGLEVIHHGAISAEQGCKAAWQEIGFGIGICCIPISWISSLFRKNATRVEELKAVVHATLQVPHLWRFSFVQPISYELKFSCVTSDSPSMLFSAEAHGQLTPAGKKKATRGPAAPKQKQAISFRAGMTKVFIIRSHAWDPGLCKS